MKQNVASQTIGVQMITAADGTAFTGTTTVYVTGDGGAQALGGTASGVCTSEGNGFHSYVPTQAETNYAHIGFTFIGSGAIPATLQVYTNFPQTVDNTTLLGTIDGKVDTIGTDTAATQVLAAGTTGFAAIDTVVDTILVDTGELQTDWTNAGRLDAILDIIAADTTTDIPATITTLQASVSGIGTAGGAAVNIDAATTNVAGGITGVTSGTTFVGAQTSGTYASTSFDDALYHVIDDDAADNITVVYQFLTGGGTTPIGFVFNGYVSGANDTIQVYAWDHTITTNWELLGTIGGQAGTVDITKTFALYPRHTGVAAAELGKVYIQYKCTTAIASNPTLNIDQQYVSYAVTSRSIGYANGAIWIDTVNGVAGTEDFVNGVADNPVLTMADGMTLSTSLGLKRFQVTNGSTLTIAATMANWVLIGHEWTLALGGQNVADSMFIDAEVSGTGTGAEAEFEDCIFAVTSLPAMQAYNCSFTATATGGFTMSAAGAYRFINCQSGVAGSSAPFFTLGTGAITAEFRRWSGGITFAGITADDVLTISGELGTIDLGSPSGAADIQIRGTYKAITNPGSAAVNVTGAILAADVAAILVDTAVIGAAGAGLTDLGGMSTGMKAEVNAEADTALTDYDPPTNTEMNARTPTAAQLAYIVANAATGMPVVFTTAGGSTTVAVLNTVDGVAASAANDQYKRRLLVFTDSTLKGVVTDITGYVGSTTTATITAIPTAPLSSHNARLI